jgi:hypothetical protein
MADKKPGIKTPERIKAAQAKVEALRGTNPSLSLLRAETAIAASSNIVRTLKDLGRDGVPLADIALGYGLARFAYPLPSAVQAKDKPGFAFRDGGYANTDLDAAWSHMEQHIGNHMTNAGLEAPGKTHKGAGDPALVTKADEIEAKWKAAKAAREAANANGPSSATRGKT